MAEAEARLFRPVRPKGCAVAVVPNGVDRDYFRPDGADAANGPPTVLFTGALDYAPNVDGVLWFAREVMPLLRRDLPEARLLAVGHRPAPELLRASRQLGALLEVHGSVPDVRPYFRSAQVYAAPLRLGRGVQNKVLEAMAMRLPVVASPRATAGLSVTDGVHLLVAERPAEFATAVLSLWREPARRDSLTDAAAALIVERYDWDKNLQLLDRCLARDSHGRPSKEAAWMACSV